MAASLSAAAPTLDAALRLARRTAAALTVLYAGAPTADERETLRYRARLAGVRVTDLIAIGESELHARTLAVHARHAGLLVLPPGDSGDARLVARLRETLRAALVLTRSSGQSGQH